MKRFFSLSRLTRSFQRMALFFGFTFTLLYFLAGGSYELGRGYTSGRFEGQLLEISSQLTTMSTNADAFLPDMKESIKRIKSIQQDVRTRSDKAGILDLLTPLTRNLESYQREFEAGNREESKKIILQKIEPSNQAMNLMLTRVDAKMRENIESQSSVLKYFKTFAIIFVLISVLSLPAVITSRFNPQNEPLEFISLKTSLEKPHFFTIIRYLSKKANLDADEETNRRIGRLVSLSIFTPDLVKVSEGDLLSIFTKSTSLSKELEVASAWAAFTSDNEARFEENLGASITLDASEGMLAHALIQWMSEVSEKTKIKTFNASGNWTNNSWIITLSTSGDQVHESTIQYFADAISKKSGLDKKNSDPIDFVRTILKKLTTDVSVNQNGPDLNLVMTFPLKSTGT